MKPEIINKLLFDLADRLYQMGYEVYLPVSNLPSYLYIVDGNKIAYAEVHSLGEGYNLTSVHKPCRDNGTGFNILTGVSLNKLINNIDNALNYSRPDWVKISPLKWNDWNHFIRYNEWREYIKHKI